MEKSVYFDLNVGLPIDQPTEKKTSVPNVFTKSGLLHVVRYALLLCQDLSGYMCRQMFHHNAVFL